MLSEADRLFLSELIRGLPWIAGVLIPVVWFGFIARHGETVRGRDGKGVDILDRIVWPAANDRSHFGRNRKRERPPDTRLRG